MANIYDYSGNVIDVGGGGGEVIEFNDELLSQMYYTFQFSKWQQGKLSNLTAGSTPTVQTSTTNYCIPVANALWLEAGTVITLRSATSHDLSYARLDKDKHFVAGMKADQVTTNSWDFLRGTSFRIVIPYDGYYCFNSYNANYSTESVASNNLSDMAIYGAEYISSQSSADLWRDSADDTMRTINHRGYTASGAIENTMPAFRESKNHGYVFIECDLRLTSDNEIVLSHDTTITGKDSGGTSQTLTIADSTLAQLQALTRGSGRFECSVATLTELLEFCRAYRIHPYLDMKITTEAAMDLYFAAVAKAGMLRNVSWSGNYTTSAYIKGKDPKARLVNLSGTASSLAGLLNGQNEVVVNNTITNMTAAAVAEYAAAGITPECYIIGSPTKQQVLTMASYGITAMTIDTMHCQKILVENAEA